MAKLANKRHMVASYPYMFDANNNIFAKTWPNCLQCGSKININKREHEGLRVNPELTIFGDVRKKHG